MCADMQRSEMIRDGLLSLYDPVGLSASLLAAELVERKIIPSNRLLSDVLIDAVNKLRPPAAAPVQSHARRCYRYLQLRYIECQGHAAIAHDLGVSERQASRIHQDALDTLGQVLFPLADTVHRSAHQDQSGSEANGTSRERSAMTGRKSTTICNQLPEGGANAADVVRGVQQTFRQFATAAGARVEARLPDDLPPIRVNRVILRQILLNLLLSLVKAERCWGDCAGPVLLVEGQSVGDEVVLSVRSVSSAETVIGTENSVVPAEPASAPVLAAALSLASEVGARIEIDSGSPLAQAALYLPVGPSLLLLVDDNPDVGELFGRMLVRSRYQLRQVRTANRALNVAREILPHAIVLDVVMPSRDGWEVLSALKADRRTSDIPVIVSSVLPDRALALSLGASDFLSKPVTRNSLLATLDRILDGLEDQSQVRSSTRRWIDLT